MLTCAAVCLFGWFLHQAHTSLDTNLWFSPLLTPVFNCSAASVTSYPSQRTSFVDSLLSPVRCTRSWKVLDRR
ncbi:hypothetical protein BJ546DRAFT_1015923 [Cryomyces antarcticus]